MWQKILLGLIAGIIAGSIAPDYAKMVKPIADVFLTLIRMTVVPVVFVSLVCGITALRNLSKMGSIAAKTLAIYFITMMIAAALSMFLAHLFHIGEGLNLQVGETIQSVEVPTLTQTLLNIFPDNPFKALAAGEVLPIIVFAIFFGIAINLSGDDGKPVAYLFQSLNHVVFRLILMVLTFAPYGVFLLIAYVTADNGLTTLQHLASLVGTIYLACIVIVLGLYSILLKIFGLNPWHFLRKMLPVQLFAFSTTSSSASLPMSMDTAETHLGVSNSIASFILPLGITINMNGLATYLGAVSIFAANAYGIELSLGQMVMVVLTTSLAAIGAAGVPGTGLIVMSMVLSSVGLPLDVIAAIAAVDRIIDMANTPTNITGDVLATVLVAKLEDELDLDVYKNAS
jgi:Na+/H+-dicarboxylate symporter